MLSTHWYCNGCGDMVETKIPVPRPLVCEICGSTFYVRVTVEEDVSSFFDNFEDDPLDAA